MAETPLVLVLVSSHCSFHQRLPGLPARASLQDSSADRSPKTPLKAYGDALLARTGTQEEVPSPGHAERAAGQAGAGQKSQVTLRSLGNTPEGFLSEGRLLGSGDSFSIHTEDGSSKLLSKMVIAGGNDTNPKGFKHQKGAVFP